MIEALDKAISLVGSQTALASMLSKACRRKIWQSHISTWRNRDRKVPPEYCKTIEKITNGRVKASQLRPDIFGGRA